MSGTAPKSWYHCAASRPWRQSAASSRRFRKKRACNARQPQPVADHPGRGPACSCQQRGGPAGSRQLHAVHPDVLSPEPVEFNFRRAHSVEAKNFAIVVRFTATRFSTYRSHEPFSRIARGIGSMPRHRNQRTCGHGPYRLALLATASCVQLKSGQLAAPEWRRSAARAAMADYRAGSARAACRARRAAPARHAR